jgi:hypothetical protein
MTLKSPKKIKNEKKGNRLELTAAAGSVVNSLHNCTLNHVN